MSGRIIDGKAIAAGVRADVAAAVKTLPSQPALAVVLVGDDPAAMCTCQSKVKDASKPACARWKSGCQRTPAKPT
jgi:methylenetetrahydrofolate dehydrogenase (NADP+)/methenyltetrahydrofolate cyclohydrolase